RHGTAYTTGAPVAQRRPGLVSTMLLPGPGTIEGGAMDGSPYWNPRHETMPRDQIEALQVRKLRNLVEWADAQVPWQSKRLRDAGVTADSIQSLEDLRRIPLMTRDEWMQGQLEQPPFGTNVA